MFFEVNGLIVQWKDMALLKLRRRFESSWGCGNALRNQNKNKYFLYFYLLLQYLYIKN